MTVPRYEKLMAKLVEIGTKHGKTVEQKLSTTGKNLTKTVKKQ